MNNNTSLAKVKELAADFLRIADELNDAVTCYINGSSQDLDYIAYQTVREADKKFVDAVNDYYYGDAGYEYGLNYELAESFIY